MKDKLCRAHETGPKNLDRSGFFRSDRTGPYGPNRDRNFPGPVFPVRPGIPGPTGFAVGPGISVDALVVYYLHLAVKI